MSRIVIAAAVLMLTASCGRTPAPLEHATLDFATTVDGREVVLTYEGTHDVIQDDDPDVHLLVLVHHDGRLNPMGSFNYVMAALDSAAADRPELRLRETTMVLSPALESRPPRGIELKRRPCLTVGSCLTSVCCCRERT